MQYRAPSIRPGTLRPMVPAVYNVAGKATITYGNLSKDTAFDLNFERK